MVASRFFVRWIPTGSNMNLFALVVYIQHLAGWRSLEGIVKLVGELFMFSLVSFSHNFSYSAHAAPGKERTERMRGRQEMRR